MEARINQKLSITFASGLLNPLDMGMQVTLLFSIFLKVDEDFPCVNQSHLKENISK
jgi:hypothetical protein